VERLDCAIRDSCSGISAGNAGKVPGKRLSQRLVGLRIPELTVRLRFFFNRASTRPPVAGTASAAVEWLSEMRSGPADS